MSLARLVIGVGLISGAVVTAQVRLTGRVTTDTNAPVTNAAVTVRVQNEPNPRARAFTDPSGAFTVTVPTWGDYLVDAEAVGYYSIKDRRVPLAVGDNDIVIALSPVREFADSVDVTAASGSVSIDQTATEQTLTGAQMMDIPFPVTHDLKTAMRALPGVLQDSSNGIHVNGGAENQTLYLLDGFNIGDPLTGSFNTRLTIEGLQAVNVESGALSSEYGKGSAGVVSMNTRNGDDRIRFSATNFIPGLEHNKGWRIGNWNPRFNVSGPLKKGRVWFSDSFTGQYDQTVIRELPDGQDSSLSLRFNNFLHVQANLKPNNIASFGFMANLWNASSAGLSALDPPETTVDRRERQWFAYGRDQVYFGRGAVLEFGFASNRTFSNLTPQGNNLYIFTPFGRRGNYYVNGSQEASRNQAIANAYLPSFEWHGSHQLKVGVDLDWLHYGQNLRRTGYEWLDANLSPVRLVTYGGNGQLSRSNTESTTYVQDSWRVRSNVTFEAGLRSDWDRLLGNRTASPRAGVAWAPAKLENTRVAAGYAVSYDATNLELFTRPFDQYPISYYYPPYGIATQPIRSYFVLPSQSLSSPRFTTWNLSFDHRFPANLFGRVQFLRRRGSNGLTYVGSQQLSTFTDSIYRLTNRRDDFYDAVEFTVRQNFRKEYGWMVSYVRSRARSSNVLDIGSDTPLLVNANAGMLPWDTPHRLMGWGYVPTFLKNWAVAYLVDYRTGFPFSVQDDAGQVIGGVNSWRYPDFFELNLHLEKRFEFRGQRWAGRVGMNNLTGHRNPNTVDNIIGTPQFMSFYGGQSRAVQVRIRWLGKL